MSSPTLVGRVRVPTLADLDAALALSSLPAPVRAELSSLSPEALRALRDDAAAALYAVDRDARDEAAARNAARWRELAVADRERVARARRAAAWLESRGLLAGAEATHGAHAGWSHAVMDALRDVSAAAS